MIFGGLFHSGDCKHSALQPCRHHSGDTAFVTLGAVLFLNERVGIRRWVAILIGFGGVLLIVRPGAADFPDGMVCGHLGCDAGAPRHVNAGY